MQILISNIGNSLDDTLQRLITRQAQTVETVDCQQTLPVVRRQCPDVLLIDVTSDDVEAQGTLRDIRAFHAELPIIVASHSQQAAVATTYLNAGADDYVRKPLDLDELSARIDAVYRRTHSAKLTGAITNAGPVVIDDRCKRVSVFGHEIALSPKEYQLLQLCASEPGRVFSHEAITERLWPQRDIAEGVDIKQYVHLLRGKLGRVPGGRDLVENVKGFGYRLVVTDSRDSDATGGSEERPLAVGEN